MALQDVGGMRCRVYKRNVLTFDGGSQHAQLPHLICDVPVKNCRDRCQSQAVSQLDGAPDSRDRGGVCALQQV